MYRYLFKYEFNMSFHTPKKDQCLQCTTFKNSNAEEKDELEQNYKHHIEEKELSRTEKNNDKEKISDLYQVYCFDLQAALPVPRGDVSSFYYKSRLNCYNFTVYQLHKKGLGHVDCYFWHEGEGKRGASEIGTYLLKFLKNRSKIATSEDLEIVLYSDNCGGQGKNKFIITAFLYAVTNFKIKSITYKFLVVGHGQNEGDASHSIIERAVKKALKNGPIYVPAHYSAIIGNARKTEPKFSIHEMCHKDFVDLKVLNEKVANSVFNVDADGNKFNFNDICVIKVDRCYPRRFFYKLSYKDKTFNFVEIQKIKRKKNFFDFKEVSLESAYLDRIPISQKKYDDLQSLLKNKSIPMAHQQFYQNLKIE
ncbi:uncharacterized protein [Onthophagus taurus]|uniref:uncharacterized protein n=1 Tax=Onthophagus taurus TaxID=166361 RepID=UPI0039BE6561